jgi:uncharacterized repeat protein (TIGR03843 family)
VGLGLVPETVARAEGPFGPGSLQRYVDEDEEAHYFTLRDELSYHQTFRRLAALDVVMNNSDRKSGHVLLTPDGLAAIDHGLCFHLEDKMRTVIWDFAGDAVDEEFLDKLREANANLPYALSLLLSPAELGMLRSRIDVLLEQRVLPHPDEDADYPPYPWPLV